MKLHRLLFAALVACFVTALAFAAEASPAGTWKWAVGRGGAQATEQTLRLSYLDGKLTGTLLGTQIGQTQFPDTTIEDASFKDGTIKFSVTRELNNLKVTTRYEGKLQGDTISGTSERPNIQGGGEPIKRDWNAKRVK